MKIEPFKMRVTPEQSRVVQETLFKNGYRWADNTASIINTDAPYLFFDKDRELTYCKQSRDYFNFYELAPELTFERFQELYCEFVLPEKWCVKDCVEVAAWAAKIYGILATVSTNYLHVESRRVPFRDSYTFKPYILEGYTEITFEQFKKYVLKQENMKEEKKIIGYTTKEGCKQFKSAIEAIVKVNLAKNWKVTGEEYIELLQEAGVLDLWFDPIYEKSFPKITVNGHDAEFFDTYVKFGCAEISKEVFIDLYTCREYANTNRDVESVTIGKGVFSKDMIKEIAEYFIQKDKAKYE